MARLHHAVSLLYLPGSSLNPKKKKNLGIWDLKGTNTSNISSLWVEFKNFTLVFALGADKYKGNFERKSSGKIFNFICELENHGPLMADKLLTL